MCPWDRNVHAVQDPACRASGIPGLTPRLASDLLVSALIRKVESEGGTAMVLAKGDKVSGALLLLIAMRGQTLALRERGMRPDGSPAWVETGPRDRDDPEALGAYLARRRQSDPDLWIVELDGMPVEAVDALLAAV